MRSRPIAPQRFRLNLQVRYLLKRGLWCLKRVELHPPVHGCGPIAAVCLRQSCVSNRVPVCSSFQCQRSVALLSLLSLAGSWWCAAEPDCVRL